MPLGCIMYSPFYTNEGHKFTGLWHILCSWLLYIYIRRGVFDVARFDIRATFLGASNCEASDSTDSHVFFFYLPHRTSSALGITGNRLERGKSMIHTGALIKQTLHNQGRTVTWFAAQLCCTRPNIYKIFQKENIDVHLLWRISNILEHDFFLDISDNYHTNKHERIV